MKEYLLEEIFEKPISGEWGNEVEEGRQGVKVIRTTNFTNKGILDLTDVVSREIDVEKHAKKILQKGDIIIEKSGGSPNQPVGRTVLFEGMDEICFCNNFTSILRPKEGLKPKYLLYMLMDLYTRKRVLKYQNKTTGIINLKLNDYLGGTKVCIPSEEVQEKIANALNKAQELIDKRKEQIKACDELIKSQFIEMFGDPVINPKGWEKHKLEEHISFLTSGSRGWSSYFSNEGELFLTIKNVKGNKVINPKGWEKHKLEEHISFLTSGSRGWSSYFSNEGELFLTIKNVKGNKIKLDNVQYVNAPDTKEAERTRVQEGDLLISITADLGRTGVVTSEIAQYGAYINQHLSLVRLNREQVNPLYVSFYLESEGGRLQFDAKNQNGVKAGLNFDAIKSLDILVPPKHLQDKFVECIQQVNKLQFEMEQSLVELENNFNSLMQRAFKGELF